METQKIVNLLNDSSNYLSKFATKKYVINSESNRNYAKENPIKFITNPIESSLCYYSYAFVLVTGDINVEGGNATTKVAFKNYTPFKNCKAEINDIFIDEADYIYIAIYMYNLIEYSGNYSDGRLWKFKRDEIDNNADLSVGNSSSFKYKSDLIGNVAADRTVKNVKIAVPLK